MVLSILLLSLSSKVTSGLEISTSGCLLFSRLPGVLLTFFSSIFYVCDMDLDKIKEWVLGRVDSIAKSLGVEMRVLVLIAFLVGYLIGNWG